MAGLHKEITVRISYDEMQAYVSLANPGSEESYSKSEVMASLAAQGIKVGIDEAAIDRLIEQQRYGREILVAEGTPAEDGQDASYIYNFNLILNNKPVIREDGSVDYWSVRAIETVEEGQVIATYIDPVDGHHGMTVTGKLLMAKRGRPLPPLTGKGFERAADNHTYIATDTGKIEMNNNRIMILPVYEINDDVNLTTGNVDFRGDVIIHGNVTSGARIHATGSVTIDGTAEGCTIEAGKDIILRGGFLGGYKGVIKSKGNIVAKFIEYATIEAEGTIELTSALNCNIVCYDRIFVNGKTANVVGGNIYGASGIEAYSLGTAAEVRTVIRAGISRELLESAAGLRENVSELNAIIEKINTGLAQFDAAAAKKNLDVSKDERRVSLLRARIAKQAELAKFREELERTEAIMDRSRDARIRVSKTAYPGVAVEINGSVNILKDEQISVEFRERQGNVVMVDMSGSLVS